MMDDELKSAFFIRHSSFAIPHCLSALVAEAVLINYNPT